MKKIVMMIILGIMLNSCGELKYGIQKTIYEAEEEKIFKEDRKKTGNRAYEGDNKVFSIVKEVLKRPVNKKIQFEEISIMIPENTELNLKTGSIVDLKTGYGLPISVYIKNYCDTLSDKIKNKKRVTGGYYYINYLTQNKEIKALFEKISKVNGFKNTCN